MASNNRIPADVKKLAKEAGITIDAAKAHEAFVDGRIKAFTAELIEKVDNLTEAQQANVQAVKNDDHLKADPVVRQELTAAADKVADAQNAADKVADKVDADEPVTPEEIGEVSEKVEAAKEAVDRSKLTIEERMKMTEDDVEELKDDVDGLKQARGRHGTRLNEYGGQLETLQSDMTKVKQALRIDDKTVVDAPAKQSAVEKVKEVAAKRKELGFIPNLFIAMLVGFLIGFFAYAIVTWFIDGWDGTFKEAAFTGLIGTVVAGIYLWRRVSRDDKKVDETEAVEKKTEKTLVVH